VFDIRSHSDAHLVSQVAKELVDAGAHRMFAVHDVDADAGRWVGGKDDVLAVVRQVEVGRRGVGRRRRKVWPAAAVPWHGKRAQRQAVRAPDVPPDEERAHERPALVLNSPQTGQPRLLVGLQQPRQRAARLRRQAPSTGAHWCR